MENHVSPWILLAISFGVASVLGVLAVLATRNLNVRQPSGKQNLAELIVSSLNNFVVGIIGPEGEKFTPFIGTLFIYILAMNLIGLVPGLHSPTGNLSFTLALAIIVFIVYNYYGIRKVGSRKYLMHLAGEPLWLAPLMFPIHVIGEIARPISLSIRLYGNVFGKEIVLVVFAGMTYVFVPYLLAIPTQFPMLVFAVFISFVQALVFSLLTTIYISIAVSDEEHGHE